MILSGTELSAESGIRTFRDHEGLWESHYVKIYPQIKNRKHYELST